MNYKIIRYLLLSLFTLSIDTLQAVEVQMYDVWYSLNEETKEAKAIQYKNDQKYGGDVFIPSTIFYNDVEYNVTEIDNWAFSYCTSILSVVLHEGLQRIGDYAFCGCSNLAFIWIEDIESWCNIIFGTQPFAGCSYKLLLNGNEISELIIPQTVESINEWTFSNCSSLKCVKMHPQVKQVLEGAFYRCCELSNVVIDGELNIIGKYAFYQCENLESISMPHSITRIGTEAFNGCKKLSSITIPNGLSVINELTFSNCISLEDVYIPDNVKTIEKQAFRNCQGLKHVDIGDGVVGIRSYAFQNCNQISTIEWGENIQTIGRGAFAGCSNLLSVKLSENVSEIDHEAFYGCSLIQLFVVGKGISYLGDRIFDECNQLMSVIVKLEEPILIYENTFSNRANATLYVPKGSKAVYEAVNYWKEFKEIKGIISFADANVKAICVANWDTNDDGELDEDEAAAVTSLGEVFKNNTTITLFDELQNFTGLTEISGNAFSGCFGLTSVIVPENVTSIGEYAFYNCSGLTSIAIPNGVTSIGESAFRYCSNLTSVTIPENVTSIDNYAFCGCFSLTSVTMGSYLTNIGQFAFSSCYLLTSVTIPDNVTSIGESAFTGCPSLKDIIIGNNVSSIGALAFSGCSSITTVTCRAASVPATGLNVFDNVPQRTATLYVPESSVNAYRTANQWKEFGTILPIDSPTAVEKIEASAKKGVNANAPIFDLMGCRLQQTPASGYYIQGGKKYFVK